LTIWYFNSCDNTEKLSIITPLAAQQSNFSSVAKIKVAVLRISGYSTDCLYLALTKLDVDIYVEFEITQKFIYKTDV